MVLLPKANFRVEFLSNCPSINTLHALFIYILLLPHTWRAIAHWDHATFCNQCLTLLFYNKRDRIFTFYYNHLLSLIILQSLARSSIILSSIILYPRELYAQSPWEYLPRLTRRVIKTASFFLQLSLKLLYYQLPSWSYLPTSLRCYILQLHLFYLL